MTKSIRSYPKHMQDDVIRRRLSQSIHGLGYWAAVDAKNAIEKAKKESEKKQAK